MNTTKRTTAQTLRNKFGNDYFQKIGAKGGKVKVTKGFGAATPEQRREWGRKGGLNKKTQLRVTNEKENNSTTEENSRHMV